MAKETRKEMNARVTAEARATVAKRNRCAHDWIMGTTGPIGCFDDPRLGGVGTRSLVRKGEAYCPLCGAEGFVGTACCACRPADQDGPFGLCSECGEIAALVPVRKDTVEERRVKHAAAHRAAMRRLEATEIGPRGPNLMRRPANR